MKRILFIAVLSVLCVHSLPLFADVLLPSVELQRKNDVIKRLLENKTNKQEKRYKSNKTKKCREDLLCDLRGKPITGVVIDGYEQRPVVGEIIYVEGRKEGISKWYDHDDVYGGVVGETSYKNNKKEGLEKWFYDNGRLSSETTYKNNKKNGIKKIYDWEGNLIRQEMYKDDMRDGIETVYGQDGVVVSETHYKDDKRELVRNYEGGKIKAEMIFQDGRKKIVAKKYDQDGNLEDESLYVLFGPINVDGFHFHESDSMIVDDGTEYVKEEDLERKYLPPDMGKMECRNTKDGIEKWTFDDGRSGETSCKNGKKDGIEKEYAPQPFENYVTESLFKDGEKISEKRYNRGILDYEVPYRKNVTTSYNNSRGAQGVTFGVSYEKDGMEKWYCSDGRLWHEIPYNMGKKNGSEKYYDKKGNVLWQNEYINGKAQGVYKEYSSNCSIDKECDLEIQYDDGKAVSGYSYYLLDGERMRQKLTDEELAHYALMNERY